MTEKCAEFYRLHNSDKAFVADFDKFWNNINWEKNVDTSWSDFQVAFIDQWRGVPTLEESTRCEKTLSVEDKMAAMEKRLKNVEEKWFTPGASVDSKESLMPPKDFFK